MDFEMEMQKALKEIFQNIQALEDNRVQPSGKSIDGPVTRGKQKKLVPKHRSSDLQMSSVSDVSCGSARSMSASRRSMTLKPT